MTSRTWAGSNCFALDRSTVLVRLWIICMSLGFGYRPLLSRTGRYGPTTAVGRERLSAACPHLSADTHPASLCR